MLDASIERAHAPMATFMREKLFLGLPPKEYVRSLLTKSNAVAALFLLFGLPAMSARSIFGLGAPLNLAHGYPCRRLPQRHQQWVVVGRLYACPPSQRLPGSAQQQVSPPKPVPGEGTSGLAR